MKHLITKFLILSFILFSIKSYAYDFEADGFFYNIINQEGKEVEVTYKTTNFKSYSGVVNIPSTVSNNGETFNVTRIGWSAFSDCTGLISVTIPNTVTNIGERAFYNCTNIRCLTLGSGVTSIGKYAFSTYRNSYYKFSIPKVIWLGNTQPTGSSEIEAEINYVSNKRFSLSNQKVYPFLSSRFEVDNVIYVPVSPSEHTCDVIDCNFYNIINQEGVEVTYKTTNFKSYSGVVNIPSTVSNNGDNYSVISIGESAFNDCTGLISVTIPNTVTNIGERAFYNCTNIRCLTLGSGVASIGKYAFSTYENSYYKFSIPKVIWLGNTPPAGSSEIKADINYVSNNEFSLSNQKVYPFLSSRFEVDNVVYVPVSPSERTCDVIDCNYAPTSTEITIDSIVKNKNIELKVLEVNDYSFYKNKSISKLIISNSGNIGDYAFYNCDALASVSASNNGYIGYDAFNNCDALTSVVASNNGYIGWYSFYGCGALISVVASNNGYIGNEAFSNCHTLLNADLSNSGSIYSKAFRNCNSLKTVLLNINGYIGNESFSGCNNLNSVTIGNKVTKIGDYAFSGCRLLPEINLPDNITSLGTFAFSGCSSLKDVTIGRGIRFLPDYVFSGCLSLPSIFIPANIAFINNYAFRSCTSLADVTFEQSQNNTEPQYFPDWTSTNHAHSSSSSHEYSIDVQTGDILSFEIWSDSEASDILTVYLDGTSIATIGGIGQFQTIAKAFSNAQTVSLKVEYTKDRAYSSGKDEAGIRNIMLNDPSIALGSNSELPLFSDCPLDEVVIGRKLSYKTSSDYGYSPFYRNTSLRSVKISDIEDTIYDNEFYGCSNLQEFECGDGVTSIGNWAFSGCSALKSYLSGTSVESIGQEAFSDCTAMTSFTTNAAVPPVCGNQALDDINKWECTLHVPQESIDDYQAAEQWKEFFFIETTGVEDEIADNEDYSECPVEIYNLSGNKVGSSKESLSPGIYIMRQGRKVEKIIIQ